MECEIITMSADCGQYLRPALVFTIPTAKISIRIMSVDLARV